MKYYTIQNNNILIAENRYALERFYDNVLELPDDYEQGKYIVVDGELVLNPDWEEEQKRKAIEEEKTSIKSQLKELDGKRIRAICENEIKDETTGETWVEYYNSQVVELRKQLNNL